MPKSSRSISARHKIQLQQHGLHPAQLHHRKGVRHLLCEVRGGQKTLLPAGMKDSGVIDSRRLPSRLALGYTHGDLGWQKTISGFRLSDGTEKRVPQLALTSPEGDAFLYTTVDDLYKWSQVMDGSKPGVLTKDEIREITTPNKFGYGFGSFVGKGFDEKRYRHTGELPGYWTDFIKFPDKALTIIVVSNVPSRLSSIVRDVSLMLLGKPYDMPVAETRCP